MAPGNSALSKAAAEENPGSEFGQAEPSFKWSELWWGTAFLWYVCMFGWVGLNFFFRETWANLAPVSWDRWIGIAAAAWFIKHSRPWLLSLYLVYGFELLVLWLPISILLKFPAIVLVFYLLMVVVSYAVGRHWVYERTSSESDVGKVARLRKDLCRDLFWTSLFFPFHALFVLPDTLWHLNQGLYAIGNFIFDTRRRFMFDPRYVGMFLFDTAVFVWGPLVIPIVLVSITPALSRLRREKLV